MLQFFKDALLTNPVTPDSPVWILAPERGGKRRFSLWLGDNYKILAAEEAVPGATSVTVVDTSGMPTSGEFAYRARRAKLITYIGGDRRRSWCSLSRRKPILTKGHFRPLGVSPKVHVASCRTP